MSSYPPKLVATIELFDALPEDERRESLISYADRVRKFLPRKGDAFQIEDVRKDEGCTDTVGIFLKVDAQDRVQFRVTLGDKVQTLTKAMVAILCGGLDACTVDEVIALRTDFVPRIVGAQLVRLRSQTVFYVLDRMKEACMRYRGASSEAGRIVSGCRPGSGECQ